MLFWKNAHVVDVLYSENRLIDTKVTIGSVVYYMSFVYGDPVRHLRRIVWEKLQNITLHRDAAWFLVGDVNELMNNSEKLGGPARPENSFYQFRSLVRGCRVKEMPSTGNQFC